MNFLFPPSFYPNCKIRTNLLLIEKFQLIVLQVQQNFEISYWIIWDSHKVYKISNNSIWVPNLTRLMKKRIVDWPLIPLNNRFILQILSHFTKSHWILASLQNIATPLDTVMLFLKIWWTVTMQPFDLQTIFLQDWKI